MTKVLLIALFGGVGSLLRHFLSTGVQRAMGGSFPTGVLVVNVLGCFVAGLLMAMFLDRWAGRDELRAVLLVGLMGGFTTFSAFGLDTFELMQKGQLGLAVMNVVLSVSLGLAGVWAGYVVVR